MPGNKITRKAFGNRTWTHLILWFLVLLALTMNSPVSGNEPEPPGIGPAAADRYFSGPVITGEEIVSFHLGEGSGLELSAGERWHFIIPCEFRKKVIGYTLLRYRKDEEYGPDIQGGWDSNNAYLFFQIHDPETGAWRTWRDQFGAGKRASLRPAGNPRKSTLYNCPELVGWIKPNLVALENRGTGGDKHFPEESRVPKSRPVPGSPG